MKASLRSKDSDRWHVRVPAAGPASVHSRKSPTSRWPFHGLKELDSVVQCFGPRRSCSGQHSTGRLRPAPSTIEESNQKARELHQEAQTSHRRRLLRRTTSCSGATCFQGDTRCPPVTLYWHAVWHAVWLHHVFCVRHDPHQVRPTPVQLTISHRSRFAVASNR